MENIFNNLVKSSSFAKTELLNWRPLTAEENVLFTQSMIFDVDYICLVHAGSIFANDLTIRGFVSGSHGRFFRNWKKQIVRGRGEAAVFCQCGN